MKILAVDTSSSVAAVAVMDNEKLLGEYSINHKKTHSQKLMPMIKELMSSLELLPENIDIYAASSGPGSFTGLRIGVTAVKAVAYAVQKPVISVPTLDAIAYNIPVCESLVCPIMDARNSQVYTALYRRGDGGHERISDYVGVHISELIEMVRDKHRKVIFAGDAVEIHGEHLKSELKDFCEMAPANLLLQKASSVAYVALLKARRGEMESCFEMVPYYLRKSQAERELEKRCQVD
ncbi:MAG: tRNA (adenosine(37)-N6)-threonylcarbamoyltransferase complex dimerization subunit type 1 TsaB [Clostridia bacterium]|nr:tRNA (adenosine(37)-N6)-threonylcarbamoyltransferase complex dimerization subunit type 1 TsaB [Clostridia bacterium]